MRCRTETALLRSPRVWLYAAGGSLVLLGVAHLSVHVWTLVLEHGMQGQRAFAMNAMRQAFTAGPLGPSLWRAFRAVSLSFGMLLVFAGAVDLVLAASRASARTVRAVALLATVFWTATFVPIAFVDPVTIPLLAALISVPLHGVAFLTADASARGDGTGG